MQVYEVGSNVWEPCSVYDYENIEIKLKLSFSQIK